MFQNWYSYFQRHICCSFDGQPISCNEYLSMFIELQLLSMKITCASITGNVFARFLQSDLNFEFRWCFSFLKVTIITTSNAYANNIKPNIIQLRSLISRQKAMLANKHILSFTISLDWQLKRNQVLWRVYQMGKSRWKGAKIFLYSVGSNPPFVFFLWFAF